MKHVHVIGYPSSVGGANTEAWHTVKLWRRCGVDVTLVPTWQASEPWRERIETIGCRTVESSPEELHRVPGLPGGVVVAFSNSKFLKAADQLRRLDCRIVWLGCMNWMFEEERSHYGMHGCFDVHVFQSQYQRAQLVPQLRRFGFQDAQGRVIRGAFDVEEFPFQSLPHSTGLEFVVGRISRAEPHKFARNTWTIYERVPHPLRARVLGWSAAVEERVGPPPVRCDCHPPGSLEVLPFLRSLHAIVQANGNAVENWPRVGLEAMAAGVPLIVDAKGGWQEMLQHGETGYLCRTRNDFVYYTAKLAHDEEHRLAVARAARESVERLADPECIGRQWLDLFSSLECGKELPQSA